MEIHRGDDIFAFDSEKHSKPSVIDAFPKSKQTHFTSNQNFK